ncbi:hypothetical protein BJY01DRAFT_202305 [Aspergillus pseudoustus]|uniref:Uncharacterized protein n=1 Tax=Aspergillus pseudoustus TaxID=1810923 RepID=A0ABR4KZY4_9EURO
MLALRDQENIAHAHQTVAASKPLNQGIKQLQPKTPGARAPKTPFKVPLKDENDPLAFGKQTIKTLGKQNGTGRPSVKDAFTTPMGNTRNRAPLGMKTTNAKAKDLQTPGGPAGSFNPEKTVRKGSTQRVKKFSPFVEHPQLQVKVQSPQDRVPDIEYMPPKPKDLPDYPDDITYDTSFPQFQPRNMALGLESVYGDNEIGRDGLTKRQRRFQEDSAAYDRMMDKKILEQIASIGFDELSDDDQSSKGSAVEIPRRRLEAQRPRTAIGRAKYSSSVSTTRARDAVMALSSTDRSVPRARAAPIVNLKARGTSALFPSRKPRPPTNPSSMLYAAATASSRTTVGYTKGREVSSRLHDKTKSPAAQHAIQRVLSSETYMRPEGSRAADIECDQVAEDTFLQYEEDEETQSFQLTL